MFSWHFWRPQQSTKVASQRIDGDENSENEDHYSQTTTWFDQQAMHFTDEQDEYHNGSEERNGLNNCAIQLLQTTISL